MSTTNAANTDFVTKSFADALKVTEDLSALGDHRRHSGEIATNEDDVCHGLGHLRAASLSDREPRRFQRRHVVDTIADHSDVATRVAQGLDDQPLAFRRDPPYDRGILHYTSQLVRIGGEFSTVEDMGGRNANVRGNRRDGSRGIARDHLELYALAAEERHRLLGVRAQPLSEDDDAERLQVSRWLGARTDRLVETGRRGS